MNLEIGSHDSASDNSEHVWSIQIYTCLCYFDYYILWINSEDVKKPFLTIW